MVAKAEAEGRELAAHELAALEPETETEAWDVSGDGVVDGQDIFQLLDKNHDGTVDAKEFKRFYTDRNIQKADSLARGSTSAHGSIMREDTWQPERTKVLQVYLGACRQLKAAFSAEGYVSCTNEMQHLVSICEEKASIASRQTLDLLVKETKNQLSRLGGNKLKEYHAQLGKQLTALTTQQAKEDSGSSSDKLRTRERPPQVNMDEHNPFHTVGYFLRMQAGTRFHQLFARTLHQLGDNIAALGVVYSGLSVRRKIDYGVPQNTWEELAEHHHVQIPEYTLVENDNFPGIDLLFLATPTSQDVEAVAKAILKHIRTFDVHKYTVAFLPRRDKESLDKLHTLLGKFVEYVKFADLDISFVPLEPDVVSMEMPSFERNMSLGGHESS